MQESQGSNYMSISTANNEQITAFLDKNSSWSSIENKLHKEFVFADFAQAFTFMTVMAKYAEEHNHHPEWFNVYKTVRVDLTTHEASGITQRDIDMAKEMDSVASEISS